MVPTFVPPLLLLDKHASCPLAEPLTLTLFKLHKITHNIGFPMTCTAKPAAIAIEDLHATCSLIDTACLTVEKNTSEDQIILLTSIIN
jgi:hypothetical protein